MALENKAVSFLEHLEELRGRLIKSVLMIALASFIFYGWVDRVLQFLIKPVGRVVFTSPCEAFATSMHLTFLGGIFLSSPFIVYHIWAFVGQGLTPAERKYVVFFGPLSLILFFVGTVFGYFVIVPFSLKFLLSFSSPTMIPMITVEKYIAFVTNLVLAFGVVFELPLILVFLTKIGVASPEFLRHKRRHAIVIIFIVSAVLTPPDWISQMLMAIPLVVLYELGIFASRWTYRENLNRGT